MSITNTIQDLSQSPRAVATRPSREEAEAAVRTLLAWTGEDPDRDGLRNTPARVVEAYEEFFSGYKTDPQSWLATTDEDMSGGYDDIILLKGVRVQSFCEHHMTPFEGTANLAYLPDKKVVGLSRLARVVDTCARRLQTQESLTEQIIQAMEDGLAPRGSAIVVQAEHQCMSFRGIRQTGIKTVTSKFCGAFKTDPSLRQRFEELSR